MGHSHHHDTENMGDKRLVWAIAVNVLLTLSQLVGGALSGSLSLIADAVHNLSDAASLVIALAARKIGRKPPDAFKTFGYKRAETIAALINITTLIIIGLYLIYEALWRIIEPQPIDGWIVVIVAAIALVVDVGTAMLTFTMRKSSMNIKAAFLHNVSDALASVGVIIAGSSILVFGWYWMDTVVTLIIAGYVLWQGAAMMPQTIHLLMEGTPKDIVLNDVLAAMEGVEGVENIHHLHIWQLDEHRNALDANVLVLSDNLLAIETTKEKLKALLAETFNVSHSTLEFEHPHSKCCGE
ncbi:MAG: cation diffusion facilitator family transporter [Alphaproteobacteria bacterium]|nr:cation diffusion facilitator family transporter [Alphaproteobacteria bacterium]